MLKVHNDSTALSLSFKPPITRHAALAQLAKVNESFGRVCACVVAATGGQTGGALVEEWKDGVEAIGAELVRLLDVFIDAEKQENTSANAQGSSSKDDNPYLLHTGLVWNRIDRMTQDLSTTEVQAATKRWKSQGEVMKDAWTEFKEFIEEQDEEVEDGEDDGSDFDDEFAELDEMMQGGKMSPEERARAEAVRHVGRPALISR